MTMRRIVLDQVNSASYCLLMTMATKVSASDEIEGLLECGDIAGAARALARLVPRSAFGDWSGRPVGLDAGDISELRRLLALHGLVVVEETHAAGALLVSAARRARRTPELMRTTEAPACAMAALAVSALTPHDDDHGCGIDGVPLYRDVRHDDNLTLADVPALMDVPALEVA